MAVVWHVDTRELVLGTAGTDEGSCGGMKVVLVEESFEWLGGVPQAAGVIIVTLVWAGAGGGVSAGVMVVQGDGVGLESVNTGAGAGDGSGVAVGTLAHLDDSGCEDTVGVAWWA
eukprot:6192598-Pleurochrysis_carterae.AAC.2